VEQENAHRLAKLCGMLGSSHDGERAAAALKATEFLKAHNLTWHDFVVRLAGTSGATKGDDRKPQHWSEGPHTDVEWCRAFKTECWDYLTGWEQQFITDVLKRDYWPLSAKQREVLLKLRDKYGRAYA